MLFITFKLQLRSSRFIIKLDKIRSKSFLRILLFDEKEKKKEERRKKRLREEVRFAQKDCIGSWLAVEVFVQVFSRVFFFRPSCNQRENTR